MPQRRERTDYIVVHAAATPPDMEVTADMVDQWHRERGFRAIGYHLFIRRDGTLEHGRKIDLWGAHVKGHNHSSVGIAMAGGIDHQGSPENNFTDAQWDALRSALRTLQAVYPRAKITGHTDFSGVHKACPCFDVEAWKARQPVLA